MKSAMQTPCNCARDTGHCKGDGDKGVCDSLCSGLGAVGCIMQLIMPFKEGNLQDAHAIGDERCIANAQ